MLLLLCVLLLAVLGGVLVAFCFMRVRMGSRGQDDTDGVRWARQKTTPRLRRKNTKYPD